MQLQISLLLAGSAFAGEHILYAAAVSMVCAQDTASCRSRGVCAMLHPAAGSAGAQEL
jgi:hypothetical protein